MNKKIFGLILRYYSELKNFDILVEKFNKIKYFKLKLKILISILEADLYVKYKDFINREIGKKIKEKDLRNIELLKKLKKLKKLLIEKISN